MGTVSERDGEHKVSETRETDTERSGSIYGARAALYDLQYAAYRDDLPFYTRLAHDQGGAVLELGAGTGRVTETLLQAGHEVVAVELSAAMLQRANERLAGRSGYSLVQADMRNVRIGRRFDLVIAPFNTLMHAFTLDDQDNTLTSVVEHLNPGGVFAFDLYQPNLGAMGVVRRESEWANLAPNTDLFLVQEHDADSQVLTSHYYLDERDADGTLRRSTATLRQRYFRRFELERALRQAGLGRVQFFGGFDKCRLEAASPHMIGLARFST